MRKFLSIVTLALGTLGAATAYTAGVQKVTFVSIFLDVESQYVCSYNFTNSEKFPPPDPATEVAEAMKFSAPQKGFVFRGVLADGLLNQFDIQACNFD